MSTVLVTGATGKQGGAVAHQLLIGGHVVHAFVRDPSSDAARSLAELGARLVVGDLCDGDALAKATTKVDAVFGLSVPFGAGGKEQEIAQGKLLVDTAVKASIHLVYSSVRGANRLVESEVAHASSKQLIEAYLREQDVRATVLAPAYFMENNLNVRFTRLAEGIYASPLSPGKKLDEVTVQDIGGMAVAAIEDPATFIGQRVDLASDNISGVEIASTLGHILGRDITYHQLDIEQVRQWSGPELATMYERFEANTYYLDIAALKAKYPQVQWHTFQTWAESIDWERLLAS
jgi:uncharacterized protein YbjT (DUF2867 family)